MIKELHMKKKEKSRVKAAQILCSEVCQIWKREWPIFDDAGNELHFPKRG